MERGGGANNETVIVLLVGAPNTVAIIQRTGESLVVIFVLSKIVSGIELRRCRMLPPDTIDQGVCPPTDSPQIPFLPTFVSERQAAAAVMKEKRNCREAATVRIANSLMMRTSNYFVGARQASGGRALI